MQKNQFSLLVVKRFLPLFITQFFGAFNDNVFKNALIVLITYKLATTTNFNTQILVTAAGGLFILPFFLFSATAGQLADKYEKSRLIVVIKLIEVILMFLAVLGFYLQNVMLMMLVLFMLGAQAAFFGPIKYSILPLQLKADELIAGNGLIEAGTFLSILLGSIFGGVFILMPYGEFIISCSILCFSLLGLIASLYIPDTGVKNHGLKINYNFIVETMRMISYSRSRWDLFLCIMGISWFWAFGAVYLTEFPVFAKDGLHADEHVVTWFIALFSIGICIGSLLCNRLLKGAVNATYVPFGAIGMTIFAIDFYFAAYAFEHSITLITIREFLSSFSGMRISLDLFLMSICGGLFTVPLYTILQARSSVEHRARVIASNNIINSLFMVLSSVGAVIMLKLNYSISDIFMLAAVINAFVAVYICKLLPDLILKELLRMLLKFIYKVEVHGIEHYHQAGKRVVIIANHTSFLDAALLTAFLPDKFTFAIDTQIAKRWWVKPFLRLVDAYPLDPTNPIAIKSLIEYVREDKKCVIFPEGRITVTGSLMKVYEGPGMIADKANATLLPISIQGAQYTPFSRMKGKMPIRFAPRITITIFKPERLNVDNDVKGRERRHQIGVQLYNIMSSIAFASMNYHQDLFSSLLNAKAIHGRKYVIAQDVDFKPLTYHDLVVKSFVLGKCIAGLSKPGEFVGVMLPNMVASVVTFFAMQAYGRVPAMLNYTAGIKNLLSASQTAEIKTVITSRRFVKLAKLSDVVKEFKHHGIKIVYLESIAKEINWTNKIGAVLKNIFSRFVYKPISSDNPAVILFTSGSEGTPKGVVLSHANIQANRFQLSAVIDFNQNDKIFNALPIFHSFGLTGGMLLPVLSGVQVFLYPSPLHYRVIPQLIYGLNATILFGTDTFLTSYAKSAHQYDFYSLRYVFSGAEKLRSETLTIWLHKFGVRIFDGYGATETSPVLATNTPMHYKTGTVGRFLPGIGYKLNPVPGIDDGGLLVVSGPNIMKGYLLAKQPGHIIPPEDGWYDTGDIVAVDRDGYITIKGRAKRFAKIAGEMVSLTMVEQQINHLWPTYQHAVVSIPDERKGEQLILVTTNPDAKRDQIMAAFKQSQINELSVPKKILIINKLPLLGSGKIDYPAVLEYVVKAQAAT